MIYSLAHRAPRNTFQLTATAGVYAIFLKPGVAVPGITLGEERVIYVGRTEAGSGFKGRDHFRMPFPSSTVRQSLAVLLLDDLKLAAIPYRRSWKLDGGSDTRLKVWMNDHLLLAIEPRDDAPLYEQRMIWAHQPPLNLKDCPQTTAHEKISALRRAMTLRCRSAPFLPLSMHRTWP